LKKKKKKKKKKKICKNQLKFLKKERFDIFDEINVCRAYINVIIDGNARKQKKDFKRRLEAAEKNLSDINKSINVLKDQITNGVEIKPKKEDEKNG
jgi:ATP-dependent Lon protease